MTVPAPPSEPRRLPGIRFEQAPDPRHDALPRLDVAVFVGFSARAPHDPDHAVPVALEDVRQFERWFGGDCALGWDEERGEPILAHLPRAVRAFFDNGGRRCHVVRVAGGDALERDTVGLFLEDDLVSTPSSDLLREAEHVRAKARGRRPLQGVHAALAIEDATLIAAPDLAHQWRVRPDRRPPAIDDLQEEPVPDGPLGAFTPCDEPPLPPPRSTVTRVATADPTSAAATTFEVADAPDDPEVDGRLVVQRALLRMCAARGDLFAVLALPRHYRSAAATEHVRRLRAALGSDGDAAALGFGAIYHPWLVPAAGSSSVPPDGAATGLLAQRARERGAWVAPANVRLRGVVGLEPIVAQSERRAWADRRINLVRQEASGFVTLSADTLADPGSSDAVVHDAVMHDGATRTIHVRRLLSLVRRLTLRHGHRLLFEPNDEALRRLVERSLERAMDELFERGAFGPSRRSEAFQVSVGHDVNTAHSLDQGRLIVEIRLAPANALTFLTVRLVQAGDRRLVVVEA